MKIALCQVTSSADPDENLEIVAKWVEMAVRAEAQVVAFPEATMACFGAPLRSIAQPLDGPWARAVQKVADSHDVVVVGGMFTPNADDRVYNTVLVTGRGHHFGYDKIHLFDAFGHRESATVRAGSKGVTFGVDGVQLGIATCYDVRFPYLFQRLATLGADAVLVPASWGAGEGKLCQWELLVRARALDSGSWVLGCDQADPAETGAPVSPGNPTGIGYSMVADPVGRITEQLGPAPGLLVADIDPAASKESRASTGALANRVFETF